MPLYILHKPCSAYLISVIYTMNFDFDARESKFERERRQRAEAARRKRADEEARQAQHSRKQQEMQGTICDMLLG
jgi:hypothetical protein